MSNPALERARAIKKEAECRDLAIEKAKQAAKEEAERLARENRGQEDEPDEPPQTERISCRDRVVLDEIDDTDLDEDSEDDSLSSETNSLGNRGKGFLFSGMLNKFGSKNTKKLLDGKGIVKRFKDITKPTKTSSAEEPEQIDPLTDLLIEHAESSNGESIDENLIKIEGDSIYGLGRFATFVNIKDFAGKTSNLNKFFSIEKSLVDDRVKYFNNSFYSLENNNNFIFYRNLHNKNNINIKKLAYSGNPSVQTEYDIQEDYVFGFGSYFKKALKVEKFKKTFLEGGEIELNLSEQFKNKFKLDPLIDTTKILTDHSFVMNMPFENNEILEKLNLIGPSIITLKPNYNFYIEEYEKVATKETTTAESTLPNLYILLKASEGKDSSLSSYVNLNKNISNGTTFIKTPTTKFFDSLKNSGNDKKSKEKAQYFENFGSYYDNMKLNQSLFSEYQNKNRNIIFLSDYVKSLNIVNEKKFMFPMNVELTIPTDKGTKITKMLYDSDLIDNFMLKLFDIHNNNQFEKKEIAIAEKVVEQNIQSEKRDDLQDSTIKNTFNTRRKMMNIFSVKDVLLKLLNNPTPRNNTDYIIIGDESRVLTNLQRSTKFVNNLKRIIFEGKLATFLKTNTRSYAEILSDKKCYNETMAFRIDKMYASGDSVIQSFWMPNDPDADFLNIIDTQIKYSEEYRYKIYAYQFVAGNKYSQSIPVPSDVGTTKEFYLRILQSPDAKIIEVPLLTVNTKVVDTPPLSPDIEFVPYYNNDNKITILLNTRAGEEKLNPINVLESDNQITSFYKKDQKGMVLYKSDDVAKRFEIMKLDKYPTSYNDFTTGFIKIVNTDINPQTKQSATAASFTDSIQPNKKYYYCFRAVDVHEKISNPTQIYEVEIINQNGMIFPIIKTVDFRRPSYNKSAEIRRFIKIKPASQHAFLNNELSRISEFDNSADAIRSVKLGVSDVGSPWDKTFKMVVTSKKTGKKCEIKFKFKYVLE
jgi:hypothetical protein